MKKITLILVACISISCYSQTSWSYEFLNSIIYETDQTMTATPNSTTPFPVFSYRDTSLFRIYSDTVIFERLKSTFNDGAPSSLMWSNSSGQIKRTGITGSPSNGQALIWDNSTAKFAWTTLSSTTYTAGTGISISSGVITNTAPNIATSYLAPTAGISISSGTAFQPNSSSACNIVINGSLSGSLGLLSTITVATSSTQNGTYTTVATDQLLISLLNVANDRSIASIPVPSGYWMKVTASNGGTFTYTRWNVQ